MKWDDDLPWASGLEVENLHDKGRAFEYELAIRRMIEAGAKWVKDHPDVEIQARVKVFVDKREMRLMAWERVIFPGDPQMYEFLKTMHNACCNGQGDEAGPSYNMMDRALTIVGAIRKKGWEAVKKEIKRAKKLPSFLSGLT